MALFAKLLASVVTLATMAAASQPSWAQVSLSDAQKEALISVYGGSPRTIARFQNLQDTRLAVPLSPLEFGRAGIPDLPAAAAAAEAPADRMLRVLEGCHKMTLDLSAVDHSAELRTSTETEEQYGEQFGPHRSSWAMAITHLAMYEAINTIVMDAASYTAPGDSESFRDKIIRRAGLNPAAIVNDTGTIEAAIFYATFDTLNQLYPRKRDHVNSRSKDILRDVRGDGVPLGSAIGRAAAAVVLEARGWSEATGFTDGSEFPEPPASIFASSDMRKWRPDPITKIPVAIGGQWDRVRPFVIESAEQFRPLPPPAFESAEFITAYKDVKRLGGDETITVPDLENGRWFTPTDRTGDIEGKQDPATSETFKGIYWGYDGTVQLCAPPRLYNAIAMTIAREKLKLNNVHAVSRLLALVNLAMADAGISAWEAKYHFLYPRPITYIRNADADDTEEGQGSSHWTPLGAPVTNGTANGRNLTPPFPAYPSGHAVFGGAVFQVLRNLYAEYQMTDDGFTFVSDEYNGLNYSPGKEDTPRVHYEAMFDNLADAEDENGQSRIWLGIHWDFDKVEGIKQGNMIGNYITERVLKANMQQ